MVIKYGKLFVRICIKVAGCKKKEKKTVVGGPAF
jgi:hypothetical protein